MIKTGLKALRGMAPGAVAQLIEEVKSEAPPWANDLTSIIYNNCLGEHDGHPFGNDNVPRVNQPQEER